MKSLSLSIALALAVVGCGGGSSDPGPGGEFPDADPNAIVRLPTWQLEDVQPESPRAGQTYGLDVFSGKIVVVTLLEGF